MPSDGELKAFLKLMDENRDGGVDFNEFLRVFGERLIQPVSKEEFKMAFDYFDKDHSNLLNINEIEEVFKKLGIKHTKVALKNMFSCLDSDNDHLITFDEFLGFFEQQQQQ